MTIRQTLQGKVPYTVMQIRDFDLGPSATKDSDDATGFVDDASVIGQAIELEENSKSDSLTWGITLLKVENYLKTIINSNRKHCCDYFQAYQYWHGVLRAGKFPIDNIQGSPPVHNRL